MGTIWMAWRYTRSCPRAIALPRAPRRAYMHAGRRALKRAWCASCRTPSLPSAPVISWRPARSWGTSGIAHLGSGGT